MAVEKRYQIKTYGLDGVYKQTINPNIIITDVTFSAQINGGYGEAKIELALPIDVVNFDKSDIIEINYYEETVPKLIYKGFITRIRRTYGTQGQRIELSCLGMYSILQRILFNSSGYVFTLDQDPADTVKQIITYFNSIYTTGFFSEGDIDNFGSNVAIQYEWNTCYDAIKKTADATDFYFFGNADGSIDFKQQSSVLHRLKIENEIEIFDVDEEIETTGNYIFVAYDNNNSTTAAITDSGSINAYGRIEKRLSTDADDEPSAILFGNSWLSLNKGEKKQITLEINNKYPIENILPGHRIAIYNTDYETIPLRVDRIQYNYDKLVVQLDGYQTFADTVLSGKI